MSQNRRHVPKQLAGIPHQHFRNSIGRVRPPTPPLSSTVVPADPTPPNEPVQELSIPTESTRDTNPNTPTGWSPDNMSMVNPQAVVEPLMSTDKYIGRLQEDVEPPMSTDKYVGRLQEDVEPPMSTDNHIKEDNERLRLPVTQGVQTEISEEGNDAQNVTNFTHFDQASPQLWYQNYPYHIDHPPDSSSQCVSESTAASENYWLNDDE